MKKSTPKSRRLRNQNQGEENKKPFFSKSNDAKVQTKSEQPFFQTKLTVGQPGDKYEQEADAVADQVVNKNERSQNLHNNTPTIQEKEISPIQRYATNAKEDELGTNTQRIEKDKEIQEKPIQKMEGEEEESLQMQAEEEEPVQMQAEEEEPVQMMEEEEEVQMQQEEEEPVQAKEEEEAVQMKGEEEEELQMQSEGEEEELQAKSKSTANNAASPQVAKQLKQSKGGGTALPKSTRAEMENSFGVDFSQVRIHTDGKAERMNQDLGAQAFAHGKDVYFNKNKFSPESREGKHLLAHELTHVVQQGSGEKMINKDDELTPSHFSRNFNQEKDTESYGNQDTYGKACLEAVRAAVKLLKEQKGAKAAIDALAKSRQDIAENQKTDDAEQFGKKRKLGRKTHEYPETAMSSKYGEFEEQSKQKLSGEEKLKEQKAMGLRSQVFESKGNIGDEEIGLTDSYYIAEEDRIPAADFYSKWVHTDTAQVEKILQHVYELATALIDNEELSEIEIKETVAKIHWWLAQGMPWYRGSAAIAHMVATTLMTYKGLKMPKRKDEIFIDLQAFVMDTNEFVENYDSFFKQGK